MKRILFIFTLILAVVANVPAQKREKNKNTKAENTNVVVMKTTTMKITVGDKTFTATLEKNSSAQALVELLEKSDISIDMEDNSDMEKVGPLGSVLPRNDRPTTTTAGDLILYQGNKFAIYYNPNSWSLTRLGKINNTTREELMNALGKGDVTVTLSVE